MPQELFQIDDRDLKKFIKFHKNAPKLFQKATAGMLNSFAFGTRIEALDVINTRMTVRARKFVEGSIRVQMARAGQRVNQQVSITGSINRPRFSGWEEQETGKATTRNRVATRIARGGSDSGKIKSSARLKRSNSFVSPDDYPGTGKENRVIVMLQHLFRTKHRRPFIIHGHKRIPAGLYKIHKKKLRMLQSFEPKNAQPKRVRWLTSGRKNYFRKANIPVMWARQWERTLIPHMK